MLKLQCHAIATTSAKHHVSTLLVKAVTAFSQTALFALHTLNAHRQRLALFLTAPEMAVSNKNASGPQLARTPMLALSLARTTLARVQTAFRPTAHRAQPTQTVS